MSPLCSPGGTGGVCAAKTSRPPAKPREPHENRARGMDAARSGPGQAWMPSGEAGQPARGGPQAAAAATAGGESPDATATQSKQSPQSPFGATGGRSQARAASIGVRAAGTLGAPRASRIDVNKPLYKPSSRRLEPLPEQTACRTFFHTKVPTEVVTVDKFAASACSDLGKMCVFVV